VASAVATQTAEAKKKIKEADQVRGSIDTTTVSSDIETIDVDDEEGDIELPKATAAPSAGTPHRAASPGKQAVEMPRQTSKTQECPKSSTDLVGDLGSHKRAKKASGQEAFGSKKKETPVVESPAISTADVMSTTDGAGTTAAAEVDKAGTSTALPPRMRVVTSAPPARC
jgi:hypothetical protein